MVLVYGSWATNVSVWTTCATCVDAHVPGPDLSLCVQPPPGDSDTSWSWMSMAGANGLRLELLGEELVCGTRLGAWRLDCKGVVMIPSHLETSPKLEHDSTGPAAFLLLTNLFC